MRHTVTYGLLLFVKRLTAIFYTVEMKWLGSPPEDRWENHRLVVKRGQVARDNRAAFVRQTARVAAE